MVLEVFRRRLSVEGQRLEEAKHRRQLEEGGAEGAEVEVSEQEPELSFFDMVQGLKR